MYQSAVAARTVRAQVPTARGHAFLLGAPPGSEMAGSLGHAYLQLYYTLPNIIPKGLCQFTLPL